MTVSLEQVIEVLRVFYAGREQQVIIHANEWLLQFQKSTDAWMISDALLHSGIPNEEFLYFGAQTLHNKILNDLDQLPDDARKNLKDSLFSLAETYRGKSAVITTQLCLALSGLLLQSDCDIAEQIDHLLMGNKGESKQVNLILTLLRLLAEEMHNTRLHLVETKRVEISHRMKSISSRVVEFFEGSILLFGKDRDIELSVLFCLTAWLKNGFINPVQIKNARCFLIALERIGERDSDEKIYDLICEIVQEASKDFSANLNLFETIYNRFGVWSEIYRKAVGDEDEDIMRGLVRIFTEYGETSIDLIVPNAHQFTLLLECLLEFSGNSNLEIADIPSRFWYLLAETFSEDPYSAYKQHFIIYYERLVTIVMRQLSYPQESTEWKSSDYDEFSRYRHEIGDLLKDCSFMLDSVRCLELLLHELQKQVDQVNASSIKWQSIEACLFAIRTLGSVVTYKTTEKVVVQHIFKLYHKIPFHPKIKYTANLIIGRYAECLEENPDLLKFCIEYLLVGLDSPEVTASAALALKHVCRYCAVDMVSSMDGLISLYFTLAPNIRMVDQLEILEGLCHVIRHMPSKASIDLYLHQLHGPPYERIASYVNTVPGSLDPQMILTLSRDLESLGTLYKFITDAEGSKRILEFDHPCVERFSEAWPLYRELLIRYPGEVHLMDSLCKLLRRYLDVYRQAALGQLVVILQELRQAYMRYPLACYLYVIGEVTYDYGYVANMTEPLRETYDLIADYTVTLLTSSASLADRIELIDEFYRLQKITLDSYLIARRLSPTLLGRVLQCAKLCLKINQKEALASVLHSFCSFYKLLIHVRNAQQTDSKESQINETSLNQVVATNLGSGGEYLVLPILQGCIESESAYSGEHVPIISELLLCIVNAHGQTNFLTHFHQLLSQLDSITNREQQELLGYFSNLSMETLNSPIELHISHLSMLLRRIMRACRSRQIHSPLSSSTSLSVSSRT